MIEAAPFRSHLARLTTPTALGAAFVFLITQAVYIATLTISCPFWDSGEYIATSYILGVPHPPGTPLYVLIGRIFSMLPMAELVATRVNYLSAFAASITATFVYLGTVEIYARMARGPRPSYFPWEACVGGAVAGFFTAFSRTFWENAIEAEVYALGSAILSLAFWLILRWARPGDRSGRMGLFLLLYYLLCLSMGIHLGTFLVLPGVILFAFLVERRLFARSAAGAMFVAALVVLLHPGLLPTLGIWIYGSVFAAVGIVALISSLRVATGRRPLHGTLGPRGLLTWCWIAALLGVSTHLYLIIRANLDPAINEADPSTWANLWKVLIRDQYKPPNPFLVRKAPWDIQLTRHFWDYARDQYALGLRLEWLGNLVPYAFGWAGILLQARRDLRSFALLGVTYLITSLGLVFYLNFSADEVRARDYFFVASFQFFTIWIGLGAATLVSEFRRWGFAAAALLTLALPGLTLRHGWFAHDRTEFHVAADYAHNMLVGLEPDAILFTNGDNDTFPLWYIQEVEGFRKDVRVVNLSLLNTDWYLEQIQGYEPRVDLGWDARTIQAALDYPIVQAMVAMGYRGWDRRSQQGYLRETGLAPYVRDLEAELLTKDLAVARILEREYQRRPIYLAVTVPDLMGLEDRLIMEGLTFRIGDPVEGQSDRLDLERTLTLLRERYRFRGILTAEGRHDESVFKDENATRLSQNYAAAFLRAAEDLYAAGREAEASENVERARQIAPQSTSVLFSLGVLHLRAQRLTEAEDAFREAAALGSRDVRVYRYLGRSQEMQGKLAEAEESYRRALELDPDDPESLRDLFSYRWEVTGRREEALALLAEWLRRHPEDRQIEAVYREFTDSLRGVPGGRPVPAPEPEPADSLRRTGADATEEGER